MSVPFFKRPFKPLPESPPCLPQLRSGGFNLLPYRQRNARLARRRCVVEWLGAVLAGGLAVMALAGWQALERVRLEAQRVSIARSLAELEAPLAEHARLVHDADDRRARAALAETISTPLTQLLDLLDTLSGESASGVVVRELRHRAQETQVRATATDHSASAAWLKQLATVRDAKSVEIDELHRAAAAAPQGGVPATAAQVDFAARLRWAPSPAGSRHPLPVARGASTLADNHRGDP